MGPVASRQKSDGPDFELHPALRTASPIAIFATAMTAAACFQLFDGEPGGAIALIPVVAGSWYLVMRYLTKTEIAIRRGRLVVQDLRGTGKERTTDAGSIRAVYLRRGRIHFVGDEDRSLLSAEGGPWTRRDIAALAGHLQVPVTDQGWRRGR